MAKDAEFILLGFPLSIKFKIILFVLTLSSYSTILLANMVIIATVRMNPQLHIPMYIFLSHFSLMEIGYTAVVIPKMLQGLLFDTITISIHECLAQFYFIFFSGSVENVLLAIMGYDRYLAICNPLRYSSIMTNQVRNWLALASWITGCLVPLMPTVWVSRLVFCRARKIDHFFCDFGPLVKLSCSDTSMAVGTFFGLACILIISCCLVIVISYTLIILTVLKIQSTKGRKKAFSTCASHFTVVSIFYGTIIFMYVRPSTEFSSYMDKTISVFYSVVTPLLNPIIYTLRNTSIKLSMQNIVKKYGNKM
ncbi:olfactory receptor 5P56-like [Gastrophryne carolinensis]